MMSCPSLAFLPSLILLCFFSDSTVLHGHGGPDAKHGSRGQAPLVNTVAQYAFDAGTVCIHSGYRLYITQAPLVLTHFFEYFSHTFF